MLPPNAQGKVRVPHSRDIEYYLNCNDHEFTDFVRRCFCWRMEDRLKPSEALVHPWILKGLPNEIRVQHLMQMQITSPELDLNALIKQEQAREKDSKKDDSKLR